MTLIILEIIKQLEQELQTAAKASVQAHLSATHSENVADNKYDTLATEAAYLAHGQSVRITQLQKNIHVYKQFMKTKIKLFTVVQLGAEVVIEDEAQAQQSLFLGPVAGGLMVSIEGRDIRVISLDTPMGKALVNKAVNDEFELKIGAANKKYWISAIH